MIRWDYGAPTSQSSQFGDFCFSLKDKRKLIRATFPNVKKDTIKKWVSKWGKENP